MSNPLDCASMNPHVYRCSKCDFQASLKVDLKLHPPCDKNLQSNEFFELACQRCSFKTFSQFLLFCHNSSYCRSKKPSAFEFCGIIEEIKEETQHEPLRQIDEDKIIKSADGWFHCYQCKFMSISKARLKDHVIIKHLNPDDITWYPCDLCEFKAKTKCVLRTHVAKKHPTSRVKWVYCDLCDYRCQHRKNLKMHFADEHAEIGCGLCDYVGRNKRALKSHWTNMHQDPNEINWFLCDHCDYRAKMRWTLKQHLVRKHLGTVIRCDECEFECKGKATLKRHKALDHARSQIKFKV